MEVLRVIHEPTAAALVYGIGQGDDREEDVNILVLDMGASSLDVTLLNARYGCSVRLIGRCKEGPSRIGPGYVCPHARSGHRRL